MADSSGLLLVPVSVGELVDKITILEIKARRISDPDQLANICRERDILVAAHDDAQIENPAIAALRTHLAEVNESLWDIEDAIRDCERRGDFGEEFVALARSVYRKNDERARLKGEISRAAGSALVEEKSYRAY